MNCIVDSARVLAGDAGGVTMLWWMQLGSLCCGGCSWGHHAVVDAAGVTMLWWMQLGSPCCGGCSWQTLTMSSKRKSLPTKVLDAASGLHYASDFADESTTPDDANGDVHPMLVTPADSDNSDGGGRDDLAVSGFGSPVRWQDGDQVLASKGGGDDNIKNNINNNNHNSNNNNNNGSFSSSNNGPCLLNGPRRSQDGTGHHHSSGGPMDHHQQPLGPLPPFVNPFFQAQLHEARMQQEQARLLHEASLRSDHLQQQHLQHLQQHYQTPIPPPQHLPPSMDGGRGPLSQLPDGGYPGCRKSMDEVLRRLAAKMNCSALEDAHRGQRESNGQSPMDQNFGGAGGALCGLSSLRPSLNGGDFCTLPPTSVLPSSGVGGGEDPLNSLSHLITAEPDALRTQEKKISEIIGQLQKLLDSIRQPSSDQHDKVSCWTPYDSPAATNTRSVKQNSYMVVTALPLLIQQTGPRGCVCVCQQPAGRTVHNSSMNSSNSSSMNSSNSSRMNSSNSSSMNSSNSSSMNSSNSSMNSSNSSVNSSNSSSMNSSNSNNSNMNSSNSSSCNKIMIERTLTNRSL
ncbi:hypothetical protein FHG87_018859 [Trinorchestia longiramus]|nr:hypothetical protein FHG87_018859 [Trinorchestia longiramus]